MHSSNRLLPHRARLAVALLICIASLNFASAQVTVTTDPVGFTTTSLLGSPSTAVDSFISNPFTRLPEFIGGISSVSGSTITLIGNPLTANQFVYLSTPTQHNHYYALIGSAGTKEGHTYQITGNGTGTLTVDISDDDLSGISANTQVVVIPYWTPSTIFPASDAGTSFTATTSPPNYQTLIRVPDYAAASYLSPPAAEYYFNGGSWQRISPAGVGDDDPLLPDGYFVVRNAANVQTGSLTNIGSVLLKKLAVPVTATGGPQDNPVSMVRPLNVALDATGLNPANGSFGGGDQLLLFNNAQAAFDKSPSATYTYDTSVGNNGVYIGGWRLMGDSTPSDRGADIIPAGTGFVIRKAAGVSLFWTTAFPVSAVSAVSRKIHGNGVGALDVNLPLSSNPGIECRAGGATQVVFTFPVPVTISTGQGTGGAKITSGTGTISNVTGSGTTTVTVNLSGGTNAQWTTVTLIGVNDGVNTNDVAVRVGNLTGDTNADKSVNSADISQTKSQSGHAVTASNFREDVTADNAINSADISIVKSKSGTALP